MRRLFGLGRSIECGNQHPQGILWGPYMINYRRCGQPAYRVRRRIVDRIMSLIIPLQRYRCSSDACGWIGNVRRSQVERLP